MKVPHCIPSAADKAKVSESSAGGMSSLATIQKSAKIFAMQTKMTLHGAGVYYFAVTGAKDQPIFNSVFEYEYGLRILSRVTGTRLLAYVLDERQMQFVLRCQRDWTEVMDDIQAAFDSMHERCWHKRRQVLSDQGVVLLVDERVALTELILQLHHSPVHKGKVADASLWPWSSDRYYREPTPPAWLDTESMLNLLVNGRRNRAQHYIDVMKAPFSPKLDLSHGSHPLYQALARDQWVDQHLKREALTQSAYSRSDVQRLFDDACQLVARQFNLTTAELCDKHNRRRFHHLMPLVIWLLRERGVHLDAMTKLVDEDEVRLQLWLRNLPADHTRNIRDKLARQWSPSAPGLTAIAAAGTVVEEPEAEPESGSEFESADNSATDPAATDNSAGPDNLNAVETEAASVTPH